jgi:hypothetical protein
MNRSLAHAEKPKKQILTSGLEAVSVSVGLAPAKDTTSQNLCPYGPSGLFLLLS